MNLYKGDFSIRRSQLAILCSSCFLCLVVLDLPAYSASVNGSIGNEVRLLFATELTSLHLTGDPFLLPLARDPGNTLGDSVEGYGLVRSRVDITLSSQRQSNPGQDSLGQMLACLFCEFPQPGAPPTPLTPSLISNLHGQQFFVNSFFDVFFDITVTDIDDRAGRHFAGMGDGASLPLPDNGPARMLSSYRAQFHEDAPNFGLVPPAEESPYMGHFNFEIPLERTPLET
ncbi:MAG: hypothetical protein FJZ47_06610 [Candidatus Tectomicrobia bacterium]|uniref:Uncharacterized protein n=1 Tax=Tectimicrobiota bacterium TaxID=2528274 RepID=A0A938B1Z0_UNCTE|nr:hypothetical protein [Candidatus Tectomicrobia bacterium]